MGLHEIKTFCTTKEMFSKLKRASQNGKNIFAYYICDKELISRISKK
jgi:hypothetical protein